MNYNSLTIYEIPEIHNIITDYVEDLNSMDIHRRKFKRTLRLINVMRTDIDMYGEFVYIFKYWFKCSNQYRQFDMEICLRCGNYEAYLVDLRNSSTYNQYCRCNHSIGNL